MTNGEKFKQTFHATEGEHTQDDLIIPVSVGEIRMCFLAKWWNAEYKEPSNTTITISTNTVKYGNRDYVVYKRDWLMEHLDRELEVLKGARELSKKIKRRCEGCKHRIPTIDIVNVESTYGCELWECKFEAKE